MKTRVFCARAGDSGPRMVIVVAVFLSVLTSGTASAGLYTAQEVFRIHQNQFDTAGDLKVKFWQREDDVEVVKWQVQGTSGGLPMPDSEKRGDQPEPYHSEVKELHPGGPEPEADNGRHAVDLAWDNLSIPRCTWVDVKFTWWLTEFNVKHKFVEWSPAPAAPPGGKRAGAMIGWTVDNPVFDSGQWHHTVTIWNLDDPSETDALSVIIQDLKYWAVGNNDPLSINVLENWATWSAPFSDMLLEPGDTYQFDVISSVACSRILGSFYAQDPVTGGVWAQDIFDHTCVPVPSALLLGGAGLATALARLRRRRMSEPV